MALNTNKREGDKLHAEEWNELAQEVQGKQPRLNIVDALDSISSVDVLSAKQGKILNNKIEDTKAIAQDVEAIVKTLPVGYFYGTFTTEEGLPSEISEKGYAYVGTAPDYVIYTYEPTIGWRVTENKYSTPALETNLGTKSQTKAPTTKAVKEGLEAIDVTLARSSEDNNELTKVQKYNASANINDRTADVAPVTNEVKALGYKVLNPAQSFKSQVITANTIYEIKDEFDLEGESVTIPAGCTLKFNGGRLIDSVGGGSINGLEIIEVTPYQVGCISSISATYAERNTRELKKLSNIDRVYINFDNDYSFRADNSLSFKTLVLNGNSYYLAANYYSILFNINDNLQVRNIKYKTLSSSPIIFNIIGEGISDVMLDGFEINNDEITSVRVINVDKTAMFAIEDWMVPFSTTDNYSIDDVVVYDNDVYVAKSVHTGSWDKTHFKKYIVGLVETPDTFSSSKSYLKGDPVMYNNGYYYFTANKSAGEWNESKVQEVVVMREDMKVDFNRKVNITISNSIFSNIWYGSGSNVFLVSATNVLFDKFIFRNNIIHNMGSEAIHLAVGDTYNIVSCTYSLGYNDRYIEFFGNTIKNDATFEPWRLFTGEYTDFSESEDYNENDVVRYDYRFYRFTLSKSSGTWDAEKVVLIDTSSVHVYYTPILCSDGRCVFSSNHILNLINHSNIWGHVYDGYFSTKDLLVENNVEQNVYSLLDEQELVKNKSGQIKTVRNCIYKNADIEDILPSWNGALAANVLFSQNFNTYLRIENCTFDIAYYYTLTSSTNQTEYFIFNNNRMYIHSIYSPNAINDCILGLTANNKHVRIAGNEIHIDTLPAINKVPLLVGGNFASNVASNLEDIVIKDNKLYNCGLAKTIYAQEGSIDNNSIEIQDSYKIRFPYDIALPITKLSYKGWNKNALTTDLDTYFWDFRNIDNFELTLTPTDYTTPIRFCWSKSRGTAVLMLLDITDNNGNNGRYIGVWTSDSRYYLNNNREIQSTTSTSNIGNAPYGATPIGINRLSISSNGLSLLFTESSVANDASFIIKGYVKYYDSATGIIPLPPDIPTLAYLPSDSMFAYYKGAEILVKDINKKFKWSGSNWVNEDGYTAAKITGNSTDRPSNLTSSDAGFKYFDTTLSKPIYWNGTAWIDGNGVLLSEIQVSDKSVLLQAAANSSQTIEVYTSDVPTPTVKNPDDTDASSWLSASLNGSTLTITALTANSTDPRGGKVVLTNTTDEVVINVVQNYV